MEPCVSVACSDYAGSVPALLDLAGAGPALARQPVILVKPNLVNASPFPVTTHPECCRAVLAYARLHAPDARIVLAEGCGDPRASTMELFRRFGYDRLAREFDARLVDLNEEPCERLERPDLSCLRTIHLPRLVLDSFVVSVAVLKAHSLAGYTGALKNMMGVLPPLYYAQRHGFWRKAALHGDLQRAVAELCRVARPDLSLLDASVGLKDHHLGGDVCDPPPGLLLAGGDPWEVDREGAALLGLDQRAIPYLRG